MAIVGFEFNKIDVSKQETAKGKINISNNIGIVDIKKNDLNIGSTKQTGLKFMFEYKSQYDPAFAKIQLGGSVLFLTDDKNSKEILQRWEKERKINKDVAEQIINTILTKCNIQSIILSNTVNLPPPVPMPKVNVGHVHTGKLPEKGAKKEEKKEEEKK
ncbi:hypothetical protein KY362_06175 [Candidatus Woesearchaeota archaeon]|nr:hypothetical protein [Candidatus Woesearchaeota archaeon]